MASLTRLAIFLTYRFSVLKINHDPSFKRNHGFKQTNRL